MENIHGKLQISYVINGEEKRNIVYEAVRDILGTSYNLYEDSSSYITSQLVYQLSNTVQTKFYQLWFPLVGKIDSDNKLFTLQSISKMHNFHIVYDGEKLNLLSNYIIFATNKYSIDYYLQNYKGIKNNVEKYLYSIGLQIDTSFTSSYETKFVYRLGYNQRTNKPVIPIINQILIEDYYMLTNSRNFSIDYVDRFFNLDTYIRFLLFPTKIF